MCLAEVYTDEDMNRIVEELPEVAPGVVRLKKSVDAAGTAWRNFYAGCRAGNGVDVPVVLYAPKLNKAPKQKITNRKKQSYWSGFHFWLNKLPFSFKSNISCLAKKEWIVAIGEMSILAPGEREVLVAFQAFFPTYPETEAKLEDFLKWLKENDPEWAESQLERSKI